MLPLESGLPLSYKVEFSCGCSMPLWLALTLMGMAAKAGRRCHCPLHGLVLQAEVRFRVFALDFLHYMQTPEGREHLPEFTL